MRVNGQTINDTQIDFRGRAEKNLPLGGTFGIEYKAIDFQSLKVTTIESALGVGATQGQVQRKIVLPLFVAAFLALFFFGFGDRPPAESYVTTSGYMSMRYWLGMHRIGEPWSWWKCGLFAGPVSRCTGFSVTMVLGDLEEKRSEAKGSERGEKVNVGAGK